MPRGSSFNSYILCNADEWQYRKMKVGGHCIMVLHILCHKENAVAGWGFFALLLLSYSYKLSSVDGNPHSISPKSQRVCQLTFNILSGNCRTECCIEVFPPTPHCSFRKWADIFSKRCMPSPGNSRNCRPLVWKLPVNCIWLFSEGIIKPPKKFCVARTTSTSKFVELCTIYTRKP